MRTGARLPHNQAELTFTDVFTEQLESLDPSQRNAVLEAVVRLCRDPAGSHPLHSPLAGWNTLEVLEKKQRVVYQAAVIDGVGVIDIICLGPRSNSEVYDTVEALSQSGLISDDALTQIWAALKLLDVVAETVGLDEWDYQPAAAPEGMRKAAVASGAFPADVASVLSKDELEAGLEAAWGDDGLVDVERAISAALGRHRSASRPNPGEVLRQRSEPRCAAYMPRARTLCIRRQGHNGPHRAS